MPYLNITIEMAQCDILSKENKKTFHAVKDLYFEGTLVLVLKKVILGDSGYH